MENIMQTTMIRQGDVLLIARPAPKNARRVEGSRGLRVPGERTGHAHELPAEVYDTPAGRLLHLEAPAILRHEEHGPIEVPAGWWEPRIQREFQPGRSPANRYQFD